MTAGFTRPKSPRGMRDRSAASQVSISGGCPACGMMCVDVIGMIGKPGQVISNAPIFRLEGYMHLPGLRRLGHRNSRVGRDVAKGDKSLPIAGRARRLVPGVIQRSQIMRESAVLTSGGKPTSDGLAIIEDLQFLLASAIMPLPWQR